MVGFVPERKALEALENTILERTRIREEREEEEKKRREEGRRSLNVSLEMDSELDRSLTFERRLRKEVDNMPLRKTFHQLGETSQLLCSSTSPKLTEMSPSAFRYQSVVSSLSPTLAALASPLSLHWRLRMGETLTGRRLDELSSSSQKRKRRGGERDGEAEEVALVGDLRNRIREDLDASYLFEKKLKAALEK